MSVTFNEFFSRIDEAYPTWGSSPRIDKPTGQLTRRSRTRGKTGPTLDWRAPESNQVKPKPQKPSGGITFVNSGIEKPKSSEVKLGLGKLGKGKKSPVTFNRSMRKRGYVPISGSGAEVTGAANISLVRGLRRQAQVQEFINLYKKSTLVS